MRRFNVLIILCVTYTHQITCDDNWQQKFVVHTSNSLVPFIQEENVKFEAAENRSIKSIRHLSFAKISDKFTTELQEGRSKMKKVLFSFGTKFMGMIAMFLGGIGLLALKAAAVSKIALLLAIVSVLQYFFYNRYPQRFVRQYPSNGNYGSYGPPTNPYN